MVPRECGPDLFYESNYREAKGAGIRVGPYHRAFVGGDGGVAVRVDARTEALVFTESVGDLQPGDLRPALDMETPFSNLNAAELRIWTRTWLKTVRRELGVKPIIYTNQTSWNALGNPTSFARKGTRSGSRTGRSARRRSRRSTGPGGAGGSGSTRAHRRGPRDRRPRRPQLAALRLARGQRPALSAAG